MSTDLRVGLGFDVHPLVPGRKLILGGVDVPFGKGLSGWSDADVLTHAVIDALLGAANLGDIGRLFPPGEEAYRDVSSLILLGKVRDELKKDGWTVNNIDANIVAEKPKLSEFVEQMQGKLSETLEIDAFQVSVKAKTANGLGSLGHGEGIAAQAIVTIVRAPATRRKVKKE